MGPFGQTGIRTRRRAPGRGGAGREPSPAKPDARLAAGIDYTALPHTLAGKSISPRDAGYEDVRSTFMTVGRPGLVVMAESVEDVQLAIRFAGSQHVAVSIRSGGHGVAPTSTNTDGILIDVSALNDIEVIDLGSRRVRIGPGALWSEVAAALKPFGWAITSGNAGMVGVGGLATNGGIGWLTRMYGYTIDHVVAAQLVLSDGTIHRVDSQHELDLFWAVRGAASHLGVVTALDFEAAPVSDVIRAAFTFVPQDVAQFLTAWAAASAQTPRELTSFMNIVNRGDQTVVMLTAVWASSDAAAASPHLQRLARLAPLAQHDARVVSYADLMPPGEAPHRGQQQMSVRNGFLASLTSEIATWIAGAVRAPGIRQIEVRTLGGATADVPSDSTAFSHRTAQYFLSAWAEPAADHLDSLWAPLTALLSGSYGAYSTDARAARWSESYPAGVQARIAAIAERYRVSPVFESPAHLDSVHANDAPQMIERA